MWRNSPVRRIFFALPAMFLATTGREAAAQAARSPAPEHAPCSVVITGDVQAGQAFHAAISPSLQLLLDPVPHGWILRVLPSTGPMPPDDMAELATPPFRSINPLLLTTDFGFRAQDVVGWNPRPFHYLRRRADLAAAEQAFLAVVSPPHPTPAEQLAVVRIASNAAEGRLEILDARLVPGTADQSSAAALVATHFLSTAHSILQPDSRAGGPLGRVDWMRFRATLEGGIPRRAGGACH